MVYSVAISRSGQLTIPKDLREFLGLEGAKRVTLEKQKNGVAIKRRMSEKEFRAELDKHISAKTRAIMEADRKKGITTVNQIMQEIAKDPKVQAKLEEEYGPNPSPRYS